MPWGAAAVAGATIVGGMMAADASKSAANTSADAQRYAADQAAKSAQFKPIGLTTNLGTSNFAYNDDGSLKSAGYTLDPRLQGIQNNVFGQAQGYDPTKVGQAAQPLYGGASGLFGLGNQYLAQSPQQAAQDWMTQQQGLLAPGREQQLASLRNQQFQTGRTGLATGGTTAGGLQQTNPEMAAFYNAQAQNDRTLAAQADQYGMQRTQFGAGLFNSGAGLLSQVPALTTAGYSPLQTQLGMIGSIEGMGQQPFDLSTALGAKQATAGANVGNALLTGGINAAKTQQMGNQYSPAGAALMGLGSNQNLQDWFSSQLNGSYNSNSNNYYTNPSSGGSFGGSNFQVPQQDTSSWFSQPATAGSFGGSNFQVY